MKATGKQDRLQRALPVRLSGRLAAVLLPTAATIVLSVSSAAAVSHPPTVSTGGVSSLTFSSVVLHGSVDAQGQATTYVFQYGATKAYGAQTPLASAGAGTATVKVSQAVGGLQPVTRYHYRIVATSPAGATAGTDHTFTTLKVPLSLQIAGVPNPVSYGDPFSVQGTLAGTGAAGRVVALQINPFPYLAGFATVGNPEVTSPTGGFSFPVVGLLQNSQLRVVTVGAPAVSSPVLVEGVAVRVTFHARRVHRHRRGRFFRLYGTVTPAEVGARVGFQLLRPGSSSVNKGGAFVRSGTASVSRFSSIVRIRRRGVYEALVEINDGSHVSAYSAPVRIR
ncbi:MAG TPA: hypothetical protein VFV03_08265 [Solirubrobacteraceae bacterium]|nr:hypothetical protein [Solirubrobacteraceae bacterium]